MSMVSTKSDVKVSALISNKWFNEASLKHEAPCSPEGRSRKSVKVCECTLQISRRVLSVTILGGVPLRGWAWVCRWRRLRELRRGGFFNRGGSKASSIS